MKYSDLERIRDAGFISDEQTAQIAEHFHLSKEGGRSFLTVISFLGAILVACGIVLLISANWQDIPRGVKIAGGILLMLGCYGAGWYFREQTGRYPKTGEALYFAGAALFLGNIALLGQVYHLSSRAPNAFLLWWLGIAALPFILRSKALHVLSLIAFCLWFGMELNEHSSPLYYGDERQLLLYALLGMAFIGLSYLLRKTPFASFAHPTETLGVLGLAGFSYPLAWRDFYGGSDALTRFTPVLFPVLLSIALVLVWTGVATLKALDRQWRVTWGASLTAFAVLLAVAHYVPEPRGIYLHWFASLLLFVFALLMVRVAVQLQSKMMVNSATALLGLVILSSYINLFGSMTQTGLVFIIGGIFLLAMSVYLEKQRRSVLRQMRPNP